MRFSVASLLSRDPSSKLTAWLTRPLAAVLAVLLVAIGLATVPSEVAQAANTMTLTAVSSGSVLAGQPATVTLTATNPTATDEYNVSFTYVLPAGVTYVAGSAGAAAGDPTIVTITDSAGPPMVTHQVLVWQNLSDLSANSSASVGFQVQSTAPVGSTFAGTANAYAQSDPRTVPIVRRERERRRRHVLRLGLRHRVVDDGLGPER